MESSPTQNSRSYLAETLQVEEGESQAAVAALVYFFLLVMAYYVLKPLRESLTLNLGIDQLPRMNLVVLGSLVLANALYTWVVGIWPRQRFIPFISRFFSISLLLFFLAFRFFDQDQTASVPDVARIFFVALFSIWVTAFSLVSISMFWSFLNDVFSTRQGTKLYAFIGYGGLLGGLAGGILTANLSRFMETSWLFLLAALLIEPTVWCMRFIHRESMSWEIRPSVQMGTSALPRSSSASPWDGLLQIIKVPLLLFMALEMLLYTFSGAIFQYQIGKVLISTLSSSQERTIFIAQVYNVLNVLALLMQFLITRISLRSTFPILGLLLIPLIQFLGSAAFFFLPGLYLAAGVFAVRSALNYSTGRAVRELMYTPLSRDEKYQGKGFIDTVVFRAGTGLSAVFLLIGTTRTPFLDLVMIMLSLLSLVLINMIWSAYCKRINPCPKEEGEEAVSAGQSQ